MKNFRTVTSITGAKDHYRNPRTDLTFCGREISGNGTGENMCKLCVNAAEKMAAYADRIGYDARVAETQDDVMNEATPVEQTADQAADAVIRRHKLSDTMVETLTYRYSTAPEAANAEMWCDARTERALVKRGLMHPTESCRTELGHAVARTILAVVTWPTPQIPGQLDLLNEIGRQVEPEADAKAIERDRYAKTVAQELSPHCTAVGVFHTDGSVPDPDRLIREIRTAMTEIITCDAEAGFMHTYRLAQRIVQFGWLMAYVMELGTVDADGWQDRRRGPMDGWADLQTYDLDPDSAESLPAWADHGGQDALCGAVIRPVLRDEPAEHCGNGVTREAYYAAGDVTMCDEHQAAYDRAGDEPW